MGRPAIHDDDTRTALVDAAEELLATGGPGAVSVRAAAEAIDTSTRAVYSVFGSKQALLDALASRGYGYLADLVEAVPVTDDPHADLAEVGVRAFRAFAVGRPHLFRLTFDRERAGIARRPGDDAALQRALLALLTRVERAQVAGVRTTRSSLEIAFLFHSYCHGLAANELSRLPPPVGYGFWQNLGDADMAALWRTALTAFVDGLRQPR